MTAGKPDWTRTPVYVPNDYLLKIVARYPKKMMPCISINPDRRDSITELERCVQKGAGCRRSTRRFKASTWRTRSTRSSFNVAPH